MTRAACIGECMIELSDIGDGRLMRAYGGDTLNTAVYLARLGVAVDYVTALGDDAWSDEMIAGWRSEGVGTELVLRLPGRLPGLYVIQTDARGERRFSYWRDSAAARALFAVAETPQVIAALAGYDLVYLSGVTLSLYGDAGRARLIEALGGARKRGGRVAFDTNFRARGWPDRAAAQAAFGSVLALADVVLASAEDLQLLFGNAGVERLPAYQGAAELVLKLVHPAVRVLYDGRNELVPAEPVAHVVDTTAAGDSFAAAYLAARLSGADPVAAARAGHRLAGAVVQHHGAIIPRAAMPDMRS